jgi:hypothetical protein
MPIEEVAMKSSRRDFFAVIGAGSALVMSNAGAAAPVGAGSAPMPRTNNPTPGTATIRLPSVTDLASPAQDPLHGLAKRADIRSRQVGLDLALYDPATANVYILNPLAALLWQHIASGRSLKSIHEMLWLAYAGADLSQERLMSDLVGTVGEFQTLNLIVPRDSARQAAGGGKGEARTDVTITEHSLSKSACGYQAPAIQTLTLGELDRLAQLQSTFLDTWVLPTRDALGQ